MPPTQTLCFRTEKAQKCVFFITGWSKITGPKNKKLLNNVSYLFYIHVTCEKSTTYAKFRKNPKNHLKYFFKHLLVTSFWKIKMKIIFFSPPGGARELNLRPFDSELKTTSGCSNSSISKKITQNSLFSFYQYGDALLIISKISANF